MHAFFLLFSDRLFGRNRTMPLQFSRGCNQRDPNMQMEMLVSKRCACSFLLEFPQNDMIYHFSILHCNIGQNIIWNGNTLRWAPNSQSEPAFLEIRLSKMGITSW